MRYCICLLLIVFSTGLKSQTVIAPKHLEVTVNQTTNLLFPAAITSIDRGSEKIVVQKSINNVLRVKAESVFHDTTNLTVITSDGKLYSFLVHYNSAPSILNINLGAGDVIDRDTALSSLIEKVLQAKNNLYGIHCREGKVSLAVTGLYTTGELVLCKIKIENYSALSYAIEGWRIYSRDVSTSRRRSTQDREVAPRQALNKDLIIRQKGAFVCVLVLPKPSLAQSRQLCIVVSEKDGDRNLLLSLSNGYLLKANVIF